MPSLLNVLYYTIDVCVSLSNGAFRAPFELRSKVVVPRLLAIAHAKETPQGWLHTTWHCIEMPASRRPEHMSANGALSRIKAFGPLCLMIKSQFT